MCLSVCVCACVKKDRILLAFRTKGWPGTHESETLGSCLGNILKDGERTERASFSFPLFCSSVSVRFTSVFMLYILKGFEIFSLWETSEAWSHCLVDCSKLFSCLLLCEFAFFLIQNEMKMR